MSKKPLICGAFLPLLLLNTNAFANDKNPWQFSAELGIQSDSNVVVEDVDRDSATDNLAQHTRLSIGYNQKTDDKFEFGGTYSFVSKNYRSLDEFDTDMRMLNLKASKKFDKVKLGINAIHVEADLNDDAFVVYKQVVPNLSYFINKKNFIYLSYLLGQKEFEALTQRDADQGEFGLNYYHLIRGLNNYITAGFSYKDEDAEDNVYSYNQLELKLAYTYRTKIADYPSRLKLSYRYQRRDYDQQEHPVFNLFRLDKRNQLKFSTKVNLTERLYSEFEVTSNMVGSNLDVFEYDQTKVGLLIGYEFK